MTPDGYATVTVLEERMEEMGEEMVVSRHFFRYEKGGA